MKKKNESLNRRMYAKATKLKLSQWPFIGDVIGSMFEGRVEVVKPSKKAQHVERAFTLIHRGLLLAKFGGYLGNECPNLMQVEEALRGRNLWRKVAELKEEMRLLIDSLSSAVEMAKENDQAAALIRALTTGRIEGATPYEAREIRRRKMKRGAK